eukprot:1827371-Rhodomonas_salina.2
MALLPGYEVCFRQYRKEGIKILPGSEFRRVECVGNTAQVERFWISLSEYPGTGSPGRSCWSRTLLERTWPGNINV